MADPTSSKRTAISLTRGDSAVDSLPVFFQGQVVKGFGRGSKQLGIPTANLPVDAYREQLTELPVGVYAGYAQLHTRGQDTPVYKMAMSIGWNPYFKNEQKTIEVHIFHKFAEDFYGDTLKCLAVHYIRPEYDFLNLEELIQAIRDDISYTEALLDTQPYASQRASEHFTAT